MKNQVLGLVSMVALFASSSAMAEGNTYQDEVIFRGSITQLELVQKFCIVTATDDNKLTTVKTGDDAFKELMGTGDNRAVIGVRSGGLQAHISVSGESLKKDDVPYTKATLSSGFGEFSAVPRVKRKDLYYDPEGEDNTVFDEKEFKVWFHAQHDDAVDGNNTFGEGTYKAQATITCEPGRAEDAVVAIAPVTGGTDSVQGSSESSVDGQQVASSEQTD